MGNIKDGAYAPSIINRVRRTAAVARGAGHEAGRPLVEGDTDDVVVVSGQQCSGYGAVNTPAHGY